MATAYAERGAFDKSVMLAKDIDVLYQKNIALGQIITLMFDKEKEKEAVSLAQSLPEDSRLQYVMADYYIKNGRYKDAADICDKIIDAPFIKLKIMIDMAKNMQTGEKGNTEAINAFNRLAGTLK